VPGAVDLVGRRAAGQAFPEQQASQFRMGRVVVERGPGEFPDVIKPCSGQRDRGGQLVELVGEHRLEEGLLVTEVLVKALLVDPGAFGDAGHGRAIRAARGELGGGRFLEAAPGSLGVPGHVCSSVFTESSRASLAP
jgi:hypothetical protein